MSRSLSAPRSRRALTLLAAFAMLSTVVGTSFTSTAPATADTPDNPIVTRATTPYQTNIAPNGPLTGLKNGDVITVNVTGDGTGPAGANKIIYGMDARLCRTGVEIELTSQFNASGGNCIVNPLSEFTSSIVQTSYPAPNTSGSLQFIVGTGTETTHSGPGTKITCDSSHPCSLWLRQYVPAGLVDGGNAFVHYDLQFAAPPSAPAAPTAVTGVAGNGQVTVSWTAPPATANPVTGYTVTSTPEGKTCTTTGATSCTVTGLSNGTPYTFKATATNSIGTSDPSASSAAVTPAAATAPGAPTAVAGVGGAAKVTLTWAAPASNGGSAITGYTATSSPEGKTCTTSGALTCVVNGLTNGTPYTFTVTATNAVGTGPASAASAAVTPLIPVSFSDVPPGAPFYDDIQWAAGTGIAKGYPNGTFGPLSGTTRLSIAAFLYRFDGSPLGEKPTCTTPAFSDVGIDHPFCGEIKWMVDEGYATGYANGTFGPSLPMSRQAMAAFLYRFAGSPLGDNPQCTAAAFSDVPASHNFCGEIKWLATSGITTGYNDGTFKPTNVVTRQAVAAYLHRMHDL